MKPISANKGEWSELYVLLKIIADGKLYQSDENLNGSDENFYEVIRGYKLETGYQLNFNRSEFISISKVINDKEEVLYEFSIDEIKDVANTLLKEIQDGKGNSFKINTLEDFFQISNINKIKANSGSKADIRFRIYDHRLAMETDLGFSIKSFLGGNSTLFNTGPGNNFIYSINSPKLDSIDSFNFRTYSPPKNISKLTYRLWELEELNSKINFDSIQSNQLWMNLKMVDGDLPEILSWALYYRWFWRESSLKNVAKILEENDPLNFYKGKKSIQKLYEYKIMRFLTEATMGMTSETAWVGEYDSFGGVIFAKQDGNVVCFHIYDMNVLRNYLINNTVFEQASTGEDRTNPGNFDRNSKKNYYYGWLYEGLKGLEFKINLQIRFK